MSNWITVRPNRVVRSTTPLWSSDPLFDEAFNWFFGTPRRTASTATPTASVPTFNFKINVAQDETNYYIFASLPGVNPEKLDVNVLDNKVTISGEIAPTSFGTPTEGEGQEKAKVRWLYRELPSGASKFQREITLPVAVDAEKVQAHYQDGILRLVVPQAEVARPRKVAVVAGSAPKSVLPESSN